MQRVLGIDRLEMQRDRCSLRGTLDRLNGVGAVAAGLPLDRFAVAGFAGEQLDLVGHHEGGVEADAELTDQFLGHVGVFRVLQLLAQFGGTRLGERADQVDHLGAGHADAVVADGQGAGVGVHVDLDVQIRREGVVGVQVFVLERLDAQLVQRVRRVGDQLPQERVLVRVDRVDHQVQELTRLGLELQLFDTGAHDTLLHDIAGESTGTHIAAASMPHSAAVVLFGVFPILGRIDTIDFRSACPAMTQRREREAMELNACPVPIVGRVSASVAPTTTDADAGSRTEWLERQCRSRC